MNALAIWYAIGALVFVFEDPVIEGDLALIDLIRSAQESNLSQFPRGEMRVERRTILNPGSRKIERILERWEDDKAYWEFSEVFQREEGEPGVYSGRMIRNGLTYTLYRHAGHFPGDVLVCTDADFHGRAPLDLEVRPDYSWARAVESRRWEELLGPHPKMPNVARKWKIDHGRDDSVSIKRYDHQGNGTLTITASLQFSGHVIHTEYNGEEQVSERTIEWRLDDRGRTVLSRDSSIDKHVLPKRTSERTLIVHSLDTEVEFAPEQFTDVALNIRRGAVVEDRLRQRVYTFGGRSVDQAILDRLANRIASEGFAAHRQP